MKSREYYDEQMERAETIPSEARRTIIEDIVKRIRKDLGVKPLTLCAFLQDHARIIKETQQ